MRPLAPRLLRGAGLAAAISLGGCSRGGRVVEVSPAPGAAGDAAAPVQPIDTASLPRIRFARGTTSGILDDSLAAGATRSYVLEAREGQVMLAHAIAWPVAEREHPPPEPAVRVLAAASGRELESPRPVTGAWSGRLPATGDYVVRVSATEPTTYTLAVQIPRRVEVGPEQPTAIFTGSTPSRAPIDYLVKVEAGRTLEAVLGGAPGIGLHVYGLDDGVQLARLADRQRVFAGRVETTQDYVVSIVPGAERAAFDLRITLR
jgi:hypothetical protein